MKVQQEYARLVRRSKHGAGVQGKTAGGSEEDRRRLYRRFDQVLVLDGDEGLYLTDAIMAADEEACRSTWVRIMHNAENWKDPIWYAEHCAIRIRQLYRFGVRNFIVINEVIAIEGLGQSRDDYLWLNWWGVTFMGELRRRMADLADVMIWGPAFSPGHGEDRNHDGDDFCGYALIADFLRLLDGIATHHYWHVNGGFIGDPDFRWFAGRIERAHAVIEGELGIVKPWAVSEYNSDGVTLNNEADVALYVDRIKRYLRWLNSLDYVVVAFYFLECAFDSAHYGYTLEKMAGGIERFDDGWDRLSEGEWATPEPDIEPDLPHFILGFKEYAEPQGWLPLENEAPNAWGDSHQRFMDPATGQEGMLYYSKADNMVSHFWKAA